MLNIIQNRKIFFSLSGLLVIASIIALAVLGLNFGIDFTGGSLLEVSFLENRPEIHQISDSLTSLEIGEIKIQPSGRQEMILRMPTLSENQHQQVLGTLKSSFGQDSVVENRFESIGPVIGQELKSKAWMAILLALIFIILYIAYTFRHISKPVASWKYGVSAIVALAHDIFIVTGIFAIISHFMNVEVGILFVTALLTVLGYSVNDTIVVFDRIRENLIYRPKDTFVDTVNHSVNETIRRSINTSLTTLLVLLSLYFLGGTTIREFVMVLILGTIFGTYSSIFIASPLLVIWQKLSKRRSASS
ncbi:MAG: protein translocase subunit SecF [Candidatus Kuenenbacteria bacterium]